MDAFPKAAAIAALLLAAAVPAAADSPPADRRSVSVSGKGEVSATPDRARLAMSVEITKPDLRAAQAEVNRSVRDYLAQVRSLGIRDEDISTAGLSIRSEYDYSAKGGRRFLGYRVSRGIEIVVRDLDKLGDVLLRATNAGINGVSDPQLESTKQEDLQREALAKAAADAKAKAKVLADALGVKLGAIHTLNANTEYTPPPIVAQGRFRALAATAEAPESGNDQIGFAAGQIKYSASLSADFDLVP
ncbi:MAG: oxidative stress defense protein [Nevskia sp.]